MVQADEFDIKRQHSFSNTKTRKILESYKNSYNSLSERSKSTQFSTLNNSVLLENTTIYNAPKCYDSIEPIYINNEDVFQDIQDIQDIQNFQNNGNY